MGLGIGGWIDEQLWGDRAGTETPKPNLFAAGTVGGGWGDYLKDLYAKDTTQSRQYMSQSTALRDALAKDSGAQGEQLSRATSAGGFYDSGARLSGLGDINRARMFSYSQGLSQILAKLEEQKMQAAFPYLQAQLGEYTAEQNAILGHEAQQTARSNQSKSDIAGITSSYVAGQGGGGGYT